MGFIYVIQNKENLRNYVGATTKPDGVVGRYKAQLISSDKARPINRALMKYGKESFWFQNVIVDVPDNELSFWERFMINIFDSTTDGHGYNATHGGLVGRGFRHVEETKKKISLSNRGKKISKESIQKRVEKMRGRKHSEEHNRKIGLAIKGRKHSDDVKRKMSESKLGKKMSSESKAKMSLAKKGMTLTSEQANRLHQSRRKISAWFHSAYGVYVGWAEKMPMDFPSQNLSSQRLREIQSGLRLIYRGWRKHDVA